MGKQAGAQAAEHHVPSCRRLPGHGQGPLGQRGLPAWAVSRGKGTAVPAGFRAYVIWPWPSLCMGTQASHLPGPQVPLVGPARRTSSTCQTAGGLAMALGASGARLPGWPLAAIGTSPALGMGLALALRQCCVAWPTCRAGPTAACVGLVCWQEMPRGGQVCRQRGRQATRLPGRWEGGGQGPFGLAGPSRVRPMHPGPCPPPLPHPLPLPAGRLQGPQSHGLVHRWPLSLASGVGSGAGGR